MSLELVSVLTVLVLFASIYAGHALYKRTKKRNDGALFEPSSAAVGALMGLVAFMLAFAFSMGSQRLDARRQLLLEEINAMGTLYLRADFMPAQEKALMQTLLVEYTELRVELHKDPSSLPIALQRSDEINKEMWKLVNAYKEARPNDISVLSVIEATNHVIDVYSSRVFVGSLHIPVVIWAVLVSMTILAMIAMGYQMGVSGKMSTLLSIIITLTFSSVLCLIADLDRYDQGFFMVPDKPMISFYESIRK